MSYKTELQSNNADLQAILESVNELPEEVTNAVLYTEQTLTPEQQAQARKNIGAAARSNVEPAVDDVPKVFINGTIPTTKDDVLAEMQYISKTENFSAYITIKCQGSSSMQYAKKNFTVKLYSDETRETKMKKVFKDWMHESHKYVLKAGYLDQTHTRDILGANLWSEVVSSRADYETLPLELRSSPKNGAIDGFPVKVYTNGNYQGIYTWNIGKDDWMWNMDDDNPNHVLLCAETNTNDDFVATSCNFRGLWNGVDENDWSVEVGTNSEFVKNSLNNMISCVAYTSDEAFKATIGEYLDIQSAIDYYIHQYVIGGFDGLAKNMLLATYDGVKWFCGSYDMDRTFGIRHEGGFLPADAPCPHAYAEQHSYLFERIVKLYPEELYTRYLTLRKKVYTFANMFYKVEQFHECIGTELRKEEAEIWPEYEYFWGLLTVKQFRNFICDRLKYCDVQFPVFAGILPWSETLTGEIDNTGEIVEGVNSVTENYVSLLPGAYRIVNQQKAGGWIRTATYDCNKNYIRQTYGQLGNEDEYVDVADFKNEALIRCRKASLNPCSIEYVGVWGAYGFYDIDKTTGAVKSGSEVITLSRIPVKSGGTYKLSIADGETWAYLNCFEYDKYDNFIRFLDLSDGVPFTLSNTTSHIRLKAYPGSYDHNTEPNKRRPNETLLFEKVG